MPIAPAIPVGGLAGFRFLQKTYDRQFETFNKSADVQREIDYFQDKAPNIITAEDITGDRRLLQVILGAFGLDEDVNKQAFIRKIIEEGTLSADAFANRLVEPAYREMAEKIGIGNFGSNLGLEATRQDIVARYRERQFEIAAGDVDFDMRLALNFDRRAQEIAAQTKDDRTGWLALLGSQPLREVVQGAFNLPSSFALIDLDRQVEVLQKRAESLLGSDSPTSLLQSENRQRLIDRYLLNSQVQNGFGGHASTAPGTTAISLLQSSGLGTGAQANLFASLF